MNSRQRIQLAHGGGGRLSEQLLRQAILPEISNPILDQLGDAAMLEIGAARLAFSTDSFTIDPPFFPGGDIGSLAVHGTVNDVAMMGADPLYISVGLIIAEGFPLEDLRAIMRSLARAANESGVQVATGDTKVVPRGALDSIFINTTGIGLIPEGITLDRRRIEPGDRVILSGPLADHGIAVLCKRKGIELDAPVLSDSAPLIPLVRRLRTLNQDLKFLRDPTRGGLAASLNEVVAGSNWGMVLEESAIPIREPVRAVLDILGLDAFHVANEGKLIAIVAESAVERALSLLHQEPLGEEAVEIGRVVSAPEGLVVMRTYLGGTRMIDNPAGELLPRIC